MAVDNATYEQVMAWLTTKWPYGLVCPLCSESSWAINALLFVPFLSHQDRPQAEHGAPLVELVCKNCAHALHFNAVQMGILEGGQSWGSSGS